MAGPWLPLRQSAAAPHVRGAHGTARQRRRTHSGKQGSEHVPYGHHEFQAKRRSGGSGPGPALTTTNPVKHAAGPRTLELCDWKGFSPVTSWRSIVSAGAFTPSSPGPRRADCRSARSTAGSPTGPAGLTRCRRTGPSAAAHELPRSRSSPRPSSSSSTPPSATNPQPPAGGIGAGEHRPPTPTPRLQFPETLSSCSWPRSTASRSGSGLPRGGGGSPGRFSRFSSVCGSGLGVCITDAYPTPPRAKRPQKPLWPSRSTRVRSEHPRLERELRWNR